MLGRAADGATLLLNCPYPPDEVWDALPARCRSRSLPSGIDVYAIDAGRIAREAGLAGRTNIVLQTCFFAISGVLPREQAIDRIKAGDRQDVRPARRRRRRAQPGRGRPRAGRAAPHRGPEQVTADARAAAAGAGACARVRPHGHRRDAGRPRRRPAGQRAAVDGTYPSGTAAYEKRNISELVAVWEPDLCIQCGNCSFVCPHSVIRSQLLRPVRLDGAPDGFRSAPLERRRPARHALHAAGLRRGLHRLRRSASRRARSSAPATPSARRSTSRRASRWSRPSASNIAFFETLPADRPLAGRLRHGARHPVPRAAVRVLRRLRRLRRDAVPQAALAAVRRPADGRERHRLLVDLRRQPADHAVDDRRRRPRPGLVELPVRGQRRVRARLPAGRRPAHRSSPAGGSPSCATQLGAELVDAILAAPQLRESELRARSASGSPSCSARLDRLGRTAAVADLRSVVDHLVRRSVWIVGGDGWAYDIGSGGLDHVLASGRERQRARPGHRGLLQHRRADVEGRRRSARSPSSPPPARPCRRRTSPCRRSPTATSTSRGSRWAPTRSRRCSAFREAEAYDGPSLVIAYSHCIAHGIDMREGLDQQYRAVASGYWPLIRYDPVLRAEGQPVPARLAAAAHPARRLHRPRAALPHAGQYRPGRGRAAARPGRAGGRPALGRCTRRWRPEARSDFTGRRTQGAMTDLSTTYMGLELRNPLVASASPLSQTWTAYGSWPMPASARSSSTRCSRSRCAGTRSGTRC